MIARTLILLAAGSSRRFGTGNKLLYPVNDVPMYRRTLDLLCGFADEQTALLVMTNTAEVQTYCKSRGILCRPSIRASKGISYTIRESLTQAPESRQYLFFVADQPYLSRNTIERFLTECTDMTQGLACLMADGVPGNPCCFDARYLPELMALTGDRGGRVILNRHPQDVRFVPALAEELRDIDFLPCNTGGIPVE